MRLGFIRGEHFKCGVKFVFVVFFVLFFFEQMLPAGAMIRLQAKEALGNQRNRNVSSMLYL